jgi:hypothetical protein
MFSLSYFCVEGLVLQNESAILGLAHKTNREGKVYQISSLQRFFMVKGPAADATDAPQP